MSSPSAPSLHWHWIFSHYQAGVVRLPSLSIHPCLSVPSQQWETEDRNTLLQKLCQEEESGESGKKGKQGDTGGNDGNPHKDLFFHPPTFVWTLEAAATVPVLSSWATLLLSLPMELLTWRMFQKLSPVCGAQRMRVDKCAPLPLQLMWCINQLDAARCIVTQGIIEFFSWQFSGFHKYQKSVT